MLHKCPTEPHAPVACHSGQSRGLPVPMQGASVHARVSDHVGSSRPSRYRAGSCCLPHTRKTSAPEKRQFRGSMAGLHAPLSTLHGRPRGRPRMTRGKCGSPLLHCDGLAPSTPYRSPGSPCADPVLLMAADSGLGCPLQFMRDYRDQFSTSQTFQHLEHPHWSMRRHENGVDRGTLSI